MVKLILSIEICEICEICGKMFLNPTGLNLHKKIMHLPDKKICVQFQFLERSDSVSSVRSEQSITSPPPKRVEHVLNVENPSVLFFQETKLGRPGRIKTPSSSKFTWYKLHRTDLAEKGQGGGGLALGVLNSLEPSSISEGDDNAEALTVEIWASPLDYCVVMGPKKVTKLQEFVLFGTILK